MAEPSAFAQEALRLIQLGKIDEAVTQYELGVNADGRDVDCLVGLGRARLQQGRSAEAKAAFEQILAVQPQHTEAQSQLALLRFTAGEAGAVEALFAAAYAPGAGPMEHMNLAWALGKQGDGDGEEREYKKAIAGEPKNPFVLMKAGEAALRRGDPLAALSHLIPAVALAPGEAFLHAALSKAHQQKGDLEAAAQALVRGLAKTGEHPTLLEELYLVRWAQGHWPDALAAVEKLHAREPANHQYQYLHAVALNRSGRYPDARALLEPLLSAESRSPDVRHALSDSFRGLGDMVRAQELLEEAVALDPLAVGPVNDLSLLLMKQPGGKPRAIELLRRVVDANPHDSATHYNLAVAFRDTQPGAALGHAKSAQASPDKRIREVADQMVRELSHERYDIS
ncbi:MAG TPA: tetratricopeptide repeat protein [Myxococcaceae bacterium]|jgi:tetratricopeptide (TPR) repeat protein